MFGRKREGSVVCPGCGSLVGVNDDRCLMCGRANPGLWGFAPVIRRLGSDLGFVPLVVGGSSIVYLLTLLATGPGVFAMRGSPLSFLSPDYLQLLIFGATGAGPLFGYHAWWTLLSASWLHAGLLHIVLNMMWVRQVGPDMAEIIGPGRTATIYVVAGACGFLLSAVAGYYLPPNRFLGAGVSVGASASVFGLLGALYHYGQKSGRSLVRAQVGQWALIMFVYGLIVPNVDNAAHAGGFIGGYLMSAFFNPLTPERGDHLLLAGACLLASFLAIVYSVLTGYGLFTF